MSGKYPDSFYRVTLKAIVRNEKGEVLVVRESGDGWSLPGGGISHGEDEKTALARELREEVAITTPFEYHLIGTDTVFMDKHEAWLMWIIYEVIPEKGFGFGKGEDADEVAFRYPDSFKDDPEIFAQLIYKWTSK